MLPRRACSMSLICLLACGYMRGWRDVYEDSMPAPFDADAYVRHGAMPVLCALTPCRHAGALRADVASVTMI